MKTKLFSIIFIFSFLASFAQIPNGYYDSASGLTGYQLKTKLSQIITNGHVAHSYSDLYNGYITTDTDNYYENDGSVLDMYSENPQGADAYEYQHNQNKCGNYSSEGDCYNREHLMPQSWFNSALPMKSDIHHVVPSDGKVNGMRGHFPLADVGSANWTSTNGSKRGNCSDPGYNGTVFEPIDEFKGDIARIYFYMATRYEDLIGSWENANSDGSDPVLDGTSDQVFEDWYLKVLLQWHHQDPVSQREIDRNNAAYNYQGNRNPFIDHPEWVDAIWNQSPDNEAPSIPQNLLVTNVSQTNVSLSWEASTDNQGVSSYSIYMDGNLIGTSTSTNFQVNGLQAATTYTFCVKAMDDAGNISACSQAVSVTSLSSQYIVEEDFDNCPSMAFVAISEASDKNWTCISQFGENNSAAIQINGYQENESSKDWLIIETPINFDLYTNEKFSAYLSYKYGNTPLEIVYSSDYDGGINPSDFTWQSLPNLSIETPTGGTSENQFYLTDVDISSLSGTNYIAFKYFTNGYAPTRWNVDSVKIYGEPSSSSISENDLEFILYPNPVTDHTLYIKFPRPLDQIELTIWDISGKEIRKIKKKSASQMQINNLTQGFYFINLSTPNQRLTKKIIVK